MERWLTEKDFGPDPSGMTVYFFQKKRVEGGRPAVPAGSARCIRYPAAEFIEWMNSWGLVANTGQQPDRPRNVEPDRDTVLIRRVRDGRCGCSSSRGSPRRSAAANRQEESP